MRRSERFLGEKNPQFGKHITEAHKEAIRRHHIGKPSGMKGKSQTEYQKLRMSERMRGENNPRCGVVPSDETRRRISAALVGKYTGANCANWEGGISFTTYCKRFNKLFRNRVRAYYNEKCVICGSDGSEYGQRVSVHHVNYDKELCCSKGTPLFVTLCKSCHAKTNRDRNYWEEYFTNLIRDKYQNKCFLTVDEYRDYIKNKSEGTA